MLNKVKGFISRNQKKLYVAFSAGVLTTAFSTMAYAENDWGKNAADWIKTQAEYLALAAVVIILIPMIVKKMWAAMIGTIILGAVAVYFVSNPDQLVTIGASIKKIIFGS